MQLETRKVSMGVGLNTQVYPKTKHFIVRVGRTEARVIVWHEERPSWACVACLLVAGLTFFRRF